MNEKGTKPLSIGTGRLRPRIGRSLALAILVGLLAQPAPAALDAVSSLPNPASDGVSPPPAGDPTMVAISLAHGFPLWYRDGNGVKLGLCLDTTAEVAPGVVVNPCEYLPPSPGAPPSFPNNFGSEALYWAATASGFYTSSNGLSYSALLALSQEASFANEGPIADGNQAVFSRVRVRFDVPVAGTYRVVHPFGSRDYVVTVPGVSAIRQTQDFGDTVPLDFLISMADGPVPVEPVPFNPSVDVGIVNTTGATIGPFPVPTDPFDPGTLAGGPVTATSGATYIGIPFTPALANIVQPVSEGLEEINFVELTLLDPPEGFLLDAGAIDGTADNTMRIDTFQVIGKLFDDGPNLAPVAEANIVAGTDNDTPVNIDTFPHGIAFLDPIGPDNVHGIDRQALALVHPDTGALVLTASIATAQNGLVRRVINTATGQAVFRYTPPPGFQGSDTFTYLVQDTGGLMSAPATVTVSVEDLRVDSAEYRGKTGLWQVAGTSSDGIDNTVAFYGSPRAVLHGNNVVPPVVSTASGATGLLLADNVIDYALRISPLPDSAVTAVQIQAGNPGENGPILFYLFDRGVEGNFSGSMQGNLTLFNLLARPEVGISTFADAVRAIREGRTYVNVRTEANPAGELRGQLSTPFLGVVPVQGDGGWLFSSKVKFSPGPLPGVGVVSANGIRLADVPLRRR